MPGKNEMDQLKLIFELCGPALETMAWTAKIYRVQGGGVQQTSETFKGVFRHASPNALKLIEQLLTLDPEKRLTAEKAMDSDYMWINRCRAIRRNCLSMNRRTSFKRRKGEKRRNRRRLESDKEWKVERRRTWRGRSR